MKIIDRLPYFTSHTAAQVRGEEVAVRPYQIVLWSSITSWEGASWYERTPSFPTILDTGHNHHFSICRSHLVRWAGLQVGALRFRRWVRDRQLRVPLYAAAIWLHPNLPGGTAPSGAAPFCLNTDDGIAIYPDDTGPRLPVIGLRAFTKNGLHLSINGRRRLLSVRTDDWRAKLLAWLA